MARMYPAQSYQPCQLGSFGKARFMLLRQFQFPLDCEDGEDFASHASDRMEERDRGRYRRTLADHIGNFGDMVLENWFINPRITNERVFALLTELLGVEASGWTGYRVAAGVAANGHCIFTFQLFKKREDSATRVFTGEDAPNVRPFDHID